jgi:phosphohistidine phosphatase
MRLYLLRHGAAENDSKTGRDADRVLTDEGREKVRRVVRRAREGGMWPALILSSPYKRALQTAEIAAQALGYEEKIETSDALVPDASPEEAWAVIRAHKAEPEILVTSHQPLCGALTSFLLDSPALQVDFRKSALICFDLENVTARPRGVLEWMLTSKLS